MRPKSSKIASWTIVKGKFFTVQAARRAPARESSSLTAEENAFDRFQMVRERIHYHRTILFVVSLRDWL
jgi:hypothetical protein